MKHYIIVSRSVIDNRKIVLGEGSTRRDAMLDAYGPDSRFSRKMPCTHWIEEFQSREAADNYMYMLTTTYSYIN